MSPHQAEAGSTDARRGHGVVHPDELAEVGEGRRHRCRLPPTLDDRSGVQKLATVLESEIDTLAYPKAALFGFAVGVAAYNVLSVVQAALRGEYGRDRVRDEVSMYYLGEELSSVSEGMKIAVPGITWCKRAALSVAEFSAWLREVARHVDLGQYKQHPRGPKKKQQRPRWDPKKPHIATARELKSRKVANK